MLTKESEEPDPETSHVLKVQSQLVNEAIEKLPIEFREVVILRELEELSYKEIAVDHWEFRSALSCRGCHARVSDYSFACVASRALITRYQMWIQVGPARGITESLDRVSRSEAIQRLDETSRGELL